MLAGFSYVPEMYSFTVLAGIPASNDHNKTEMDSFPLFTESNYFSSFFRIFKEGHGIITVFHNYRLR